MNLERERRMFMGFEMDEAPWPCTGKQKRQESGGRGEARVGGIMDQLG